METPAASARLRHPRGANLRRHRAVAGTIATGIVQRQVCRKGARTRGISEAIVLNSICISEWYSRAATPEDTVADRMECRVIPAIEAATAADGLRRQVTEAAAAVTAVAARGDLEVGVAVIPPVAEVDIPEAAVIPPAVAVVTLVVAAPTEVVTTKKFRRVIGGCFTGKSLFKK